MNIPNLKHFSRKIIKKTKHHIEKISKFEFEKGDPDFVDERKKPASPKEEESFFDFLFNLLRK